MIEEPIKTGREGGEKRRERGEREGEKESGEKWEERDVLIETETKRI